MYLHTDFKPTFFTIAVFSASITEHSVKKTYFVAYMCLSSSLQNIYGVTCIEWEKCPQKYWMFPHLVLSSYSWAWDGIGPALLGSDTKAMIIGLLTSCWLCEREINAFWLGYWKFEVYFYSHLTSTLTIETQSFRGCYCCFVFSQPTNCFIMCSLNINRVLNCISNNPGI